MFAVNNFARIGSMLAALLFSYASSAAEYRVSAIQPLAPVKCLSFSNGWFTKTTGPCEDFQAPANVKIGEIFSERGTAHTIRVIVASQVEKDSKAGKTLFRKGDWYCVAAETAEDLGERADTRVWLFVSRCVPVQ